ncbi:cytochrome P450 [Penicillium vulpinum]|uniref:Cytochrome P450 n=1 Tax=Penicillium vulpinum TaxID=29845 RepID=A0A1V6RV60_9EURO|nr:cytochrome P450 [Penicillium vulpinum]KAJ5971596.1 cytochrome P450 [Penicillium vulpinum]OQE05506.1 hypothetical protein PENVUL_c024G04686 [Penicillium vulpinum]
MNTNNGTTTYHVATHTQEESLWDYLTFKNIVVTVILFTLIIPKVLQLIQRVFSPLQKVPGSFVHKITSWPLKISITKGESHHFTVNRHKKYGPVAVLAPGMISVSDAHEIKRIIQTEDWPKSEAVYGNFRQDPDRPTLIAYTDKKAYSQRKRLISSMFGLRYIRSMQPSMLDCITVLVKQLEARCQSAGDGIVKVDMQHLIQSLAVDIIGITTFGQSFNVVDNGSHPLPDRLKQGLKLSGLLQFMPWIRSIPFLPTRDPYVNSFTAGVVDNRRSLLKGEGKAPQDLLQKLVEASDNEIASEFRLSDVQDESVILLAAGSETTANAELFTLMMLIRNPDKMAKLYNEIDSWYPANDSRPTDCEYSFTGMTYLQACIDEAMRLVPAQATGSPRQCPTDQTILGYRIPKGTTVFPVTQQVQLDETWWPNATEYLPERWLKTNEEEKPYWPFSAGSRVCIGKHFALQEMHLTLVSLLRRFKFAYIPGQDESTHFRIAQQMKAPQYMMKVEKR